MNLPVDHRDADMVASDGQWRRGRPPVCRGIVDLVSSDRAVGIHDAAADRVQLPIDCDERRRAPGRGEPRQFLPAVGRRIVGVEAVRRQRVPGPEKSAADIDLAAKHGDAGVVGAHRNGCKRVPGIRDGIVDFIDAAVGVDRWLAVTHDHRVAADGVNLTLK